jgi:hypothetical protein
LQSSIPASVEQLISAGISALREGDRARAYALLCKSLQFDSGNEQGWLWLSGAVDSDAERRYCLERVLALKPHHTVARRGLEQLAHVRASISPLERAAPVQPSSIVTQAPTAPSESLLDIIASPVASAPSASENGPQVRTPEAHHNSILAIIASPSTLPSLTNQEIAPAQSEAPSSESMATPGSDVQFDQQISRFVVRQLGKHVDRNDIIRELTERCHLAWPDAERLVAQIERQERRGIAVRQSPYLLGIAVVTIITGLGMLLSAGIRLYIVLKYPSLDTPVVLVRSGAAFLTGLAMVLGASIGSWQTIRAMLFNR